MNTPSFWNMLSPIHEADHDAHVLVSEWGKPGPCIFEGPIKELPLLQFEKRNCTVARIEARIEEDMCEVQYWAVEVVELRNPARRLADAKQQEALEMMLDITADAMASNAGVSRAETVGCIAAWAQGQLEGGE